MNDFLFLRYRALLSRVLAYIFARAACDMFSSSAAGVRLADTTRVSSNLWSRNLLPALAQTQDTESVLMKSCLNIESANDVESQSMDNVKMLAALSLAASKVAALHSGVSPTNAKSSTHYSSVVLVREAGASAVSGLEDGYNSFGYIRDAAAEPSHALVSRILLSMCSGYTMGTNFVSGLIKGVEARLGARSASALRAFCKSLLIRTRGTPKTSVADRVSAVLDNVSDIVTPRTSAAELTAAQSIIDQINACVSRDAYAQRTSSVGVLNFAPVLAGKQTGFENVVMQIGDIYLSTASGIHSGIMATGSMRNTADLGGSAAMNERIPDSVKFGMTGRIIGLCGYRDAAAIRAITTSGIDFGSTAGAYTKSMWKYPVYSEETKNLYIPRSRLIVPNGNNIKIE